VPANPFNNNKPKQQTPARLVGVQFLRGPIPVLWLAIATDYGKAAAKVALALWHLSGMAKRATTVSLSNVVMGRWGVSDKAKCRALKKLKEAGLVSTRRVGNQSIEVTLLHTNGLIPGYE
jgi:hypothetical protein